LEDVAPNRIYRVVEGEAKLEAIPLPLPLPRLRVAGAGARAHPHRHGDSALWEGYRSVHKEREAAFPAPMCENRYSVKWRGTVGFPVLGA